MLFDEYANICCCAAAATTTTAAPTTTTAAPTTTTAAPTTTTAAPTTTTGTFCLNLDSRYRISENEGVRRHKFEIMAMNSHRRN